MWTRRLTWLGIGLFALLHAAVAAEPTQSDKASCEFESVPELNEDRYSIITLEAKFTTLREARLRTLELLPRIKLRVEDAREAAEKARKEAKFLDGVVEQEASQRKLVDSFKKKADDLQRLIATKRAAAPGANPDAQKAEIVALEDQKKLLDDSIEQIGSNLDNAKPAADRLREVQAAIKAADESFGKALRCNSYLQSLDRRIEEKINGLLIPESQKGDFKLVLSFIYALIVAMLIGGFFWVAHTDITVRRAIFSQQVGIQFVTLFSLVIAIILFGILGILADKELAALLGGISGFILGRTGSDRPATSGAGTHGVNGTTISFAAPSTINDTASQLGVFRPGDRIQVSGTTQNNGAYTVAGVTAGAITLQETTLRTEAAGSNVTITAL